MLKTRLSRLGWIPFLWYALLLFVPLLIVFVTSWATRSTYGGITWHLTTENYTRAFDVLYAMIFWRSLWLATWTSAICFLFGLPVAWTMATASSRFRNVLIFLIAIPFLTNLMIRICAIKTITTYGGPVDRFLTLLDIPHDPYALSENLFLVMIGMASTYLPFMIFPLYGAFERFDFSLIEAAQDLGANYWQITVKVILPNLRRALASGLLLVFIPSLGDFVIPDLLGGAKTMLAGNLISEQFLKARDWPFGSALAVLLAILLAIAIIIIEKFGGQDNPEAS